MAMNWWGRSINDLVGWRKSLELTGQTPNDGIAGGEVGGTAGGRGAGIENGESVALPCNPHATTEEL
jgi:hypothetical protein